MPLVLNISPKDGINIRKAVIIWYQGESQEGDTKLSVHTRKDVRVGPEGKEGSLENDPKHIIVRDGEQLTIGDDIRIVFVMRDDLWLKCVILSSGNPQRKVSVLNGGSNGAG